MEATPKNTQMRYSRNQILGDPQSQNSLLNHDGYKSKVPFSSGLSMVSLAILLLVALLFSMGLVMIFNTTSAEVLDRGLDRNTHHALIKQLLYAAVGGIGCIAVWFIGYKNLVRMSGSLLILAIGLLIAVFLPGLGLQMNGAHRWINVFGNSFQPSEFAKFLIPLYCIHVFTRLSTPMTWFVFLRLLGKIALPIGLILIEPDNGTVAMIMIALVVVFILTRLKWTYWALPLMILFSLGVGVASQMPHVNDRIQIYLHPEFDLKGKGHQPYQAKIATGSGRLWGRGFGESLQKLEYLPEARSDYIAAIFAEECGFIGMTVLILIYMSIGFCGFYIAGRALDQEGYYVAAIFTFLICFQAFLNLGVVSGLLPSKGTNLPFFSQGGSSLLANMMAVCMILSVHRVHRSSFST